MAIVRRDFGQTFDARELMSGPQPARDATALRGGRGATWAATATGLGEFVVRPGRRGGWAGRVLRSRYLVGHRFLDELELTERLRRRGAPVPAALAAVQRRQAIGYETWLVTRRAAARPLPDVVATVGPAGVGRAMDEAGRLVGAFHAAGGEHADLNANNLLLGGCEAGGGGLVIDLDRGRMRAGGASPQARRSDLQRLRRSLAKLGLEECLAAWSRFEGGYESAGPAAAGAAAET
jgi:3-deoxy-D-manno-octulosonic acid kinase